MDAVPKSFRAFVSEPAGDANRRGVRELDTAELPDGEVLVRVAWSSVNYKDALAASWNGRVARINPIVPGIDLAGTVVASTDDRCSPGDSVLAHGHELGVSRYGGFAELAAVPADWVIPLPQGLSSRDAMVVGTAGFTAALSVHHLQARGLDPRDGPVLVTGATGGVGSAAVSMLAGLGYEVVASTGKKEETYLRSLGAADVISRDDTSVAAERPLDKQRWSGAVDCVGGATLSYVVRTLRYGGAVAASGLTGGTNLEMTVLPFILRGVSLLGIDSVETPLSLRRAIWDRIAGDLRPRDLELMSSEVGLDDLSDALDSILAGAGRGRVVVRVS